LVDALDLGSSVAIRGGSIPPARTINEGLSMWTEWLPNDGREEVVEEIPNELKQYHAMIDIETLATEPHAVMLSIGVVIYDPNDAANEPPIGRHHYILNPTEQIIAGRTIDPKTVKFWSEQGKDALQSITRTDEGVYSAEECIRSINNLFLRYNVEAVWGNGSNFDNEVVNDLCRTIGVKEVIYYRWHRCYRTLRALFGHLVGDEGHMDSPEVAHNALSDAEYQMRQHKRMHQALRKLGLFESAF
jgi:hypothetical protein